MASVRFDHVFKTFGGSVVVDDLCLDVADGEFLVVVGPSGCGKTTSLRMLAGLERPSYGSIAIDGLVVNKVAPKDRDVAMVFQNYALFPHMTVHDNLAYGMRVRGESKLSIATQIQTVADTLGLDRLLGRRPAQLSGGEKQRVALGRALLRRPKVFLMDEPLSNLDAALRVQMRAEISRLHRQFGVTTVYVTHDQVEALTMGDRVAVMDQGRLLQVAPPEILYERPDNLFVGTFIGAPRMNVVDGRLTASAGQHGVECFGQHIALASTAFAVGSQDDATDVIVGIRPEDLSWATYAAHDQVVHLKGQVEIVEPMGAETYVGVRVGELLLRSRFPRGCGVQVADLVQLALDPARLHIFRAESGESLQRKEHGRSVSTIQTGPVE